MIENTTGELKATRYLFTRNLHEMTREKSISYYGYGIHNSISESISKKTGKRLGFSCSVELLKDYLYYLPQNTTLRDASSFNFYDNSLPFLTQSSHMFDDIYIGTHPGDRDLKDILHRADRIVVCLKQDLSALTDYYSLYSSLLPKSHFLICSYKQNKKPAISDFLKKFGIPSSCISAVPYNAAFAQALSRGELFDFMYDNYYCLKGRGNEQLMTKLMYVADRISLYRTEQNLERKEIVNGVF